MAIIETCLKCKRKREYDGVDMNCHHDGYWYLDSPYFYHREKGLN